MKRRTFIKSAGAAGLITFIDLSDTHQLFDNNDESIREEDFKHPGDAFSPQVMWFWMNGNVTKEGITLDLEAMKQVGIGGVLNFDVGTGIPKGPVNYLSEDWLQLKIHAIRECDRLGLEFIMHNCPGWSSSGGPWIRPELAMQEITWSETYISGGRQINIDLPTPANRLNYYRDIAVISFPSLAGEDLLQTVRVSSRSGAIDTKLLTGKDPKGVIVEPAPGGNAWLQFEFTQPYEARLITFFISAVAAKTTIAKPLDFGERTSILLEASDDGIQFHAVTPINTGLETELLLDYKFIVFDIPVTRAKYFRLSSTQTRRYKQVQFSGITRLKNWMEKTNHRGRTSMYVDDASTVETINKQAVLPGSIINLDEVLNISEFVNDGSLTWNAPVGNWTILRIGFTPTGALNHAAPDTGIGLECDKYNPSAMEFHFYNMMKDLLPTIKPLVAKGKVGLEIDSYEAGAQNWTPGFEQAFKKRWNYEINKFLPALAGGRIVDSVGTTERFLWDIRRIQADMMAENYYGRFHELCHQYGIITYIEPYDSGPMEEMQIGSRSDINLCEFWNGISSVTPAKTPILRTPKLVSSISHINGQKITGAEAYTAEPDSGRWQSHPFALKALGDKIFASGVNRMLIHRYAHQPHRSAYPGMTMGPWGIHFERTNTWWPQSKPWLTYLARTQFMLQQGRFSADLLYFAGEDANMSTKTIRDDLTPRPPDGYDYDMINAETIFKKVKIADNEIVLANGMAYKVFVYQNFKIVTLALLRKLKELVFQGMTLVGEKPEHVAGIGSRSGDEEFKQLAKELWDDNHDKVGKKLGKGQVFWNQSLASVLQQLNIEPDFEFTSRSGDAPIVYTHRKLKDGDIFFISNQRRTYEEIVCTFRIKNKQPERWDPVTGETAQFPFYELTGTRVRMPVNLAPCGSVFVVFRAPASSRRLHLLTRNNNVALSTKNFSAVSGKFYREAVNSFTIAFRARPEINILLDPVFTMGSIAQPWTEYYAIYPSSGNELYGVGHATCGVTVGRNGIAVWENADDDPTLVLAAPVAIAGWSDVAIRYEEGVPAVCFNGKAIAQGQKSKNIVHPAPDKAYLSKGASYYNGDMSKPLVYEDALSDEAINKLVSATPPLELSPFAAEIAFGKRRAMSIRQNGDYTLNDNLGETVTFAVSDIDNPIELNGAWQVTFPPEHGAPAQIILSELISLHKHPDADIKYFSGTAVYTKTFTIANKSSGNKRWLLDLGGVEVIAEVKLNGNYLGTLWTRPYEVDVTETLREGSNKLEVSVTNLWPNRLIGDEQLPDPDKFTPGGGAGGREGLIGGYIEQLPDWYIKGQPKPADGRITFTTWKHYIKDSPLLESGLTGPVRLLQALVRQL